MKCLVIVFLCGWNAAASADGDWEDLTRFFADWRAFEQPPLLEGAPDYRPATQAARLAELPAWRQRLEAFETADWSIEQQVDWYLLWAEINGLEFNLRVLQPWTRDPAFYTSVWTYQSDTPAHEGPHHHAIIDTWTYDFPLDAAGEERLAAGLRTIPPLLEQARGNLTGNARELWLGGIKNLRDQAAVLRELTGRTENAGEPLRAALHEAIGATDRFVTWLEEQGGHKTGPSGIGKAYYTWQLRNVHLVPLSWTDEERLLRRELARALSSLKLEEHRNRDLPPLMPIASAEEWEARADAAVIQFRDFLRDSEMLPPYDYIEPALRAQTGRFVPEAERNFFWTVAHHEPLALWTHWYHWFDLARIASQPHPSPIRRGPLLYNIWDSRAEGMATGFEEMAMHAGLFDANPRARELVWIMLAQRSARGLGSLYAHANRFSMKEARDFHVTWTPRGWMREDLDLLGFEQLLYLRQPGYGTTYITGKYLIEQLLGERGEALGESFRLDRFFADLDDAGVIPVSLIRWQLTGQADEIHALVQRYRPLESLTVNGDGSLAH